MTVNEALLLGFLIGFLITFIGIGICTNAVTLFFDTYEEIIERIDTHKRWKAKRVAYEVSSDLKDIEEWMDREDVKDVIASKEFGVWLRHRVTAEIERKFEIAEQVKE